MDTPLINMIYIGNNQKQILHEGEGFLCKRRGWLGHTIPVCPHSRPRPADQSSTSKHLENNEMEEWKTVAFSRRKNNSTNRQKQKSPSTQSQAQNIKVKIFDAVLGKFLETSNFQYTSNDGQGYGMTQPFELHQGKDATLTSSWAQCF